MFKFALVLVRVRIRTINYKNMNNITKIVLIASCMALAFMTATSCEKSDSQPVICVSDPIGTLEVNDTTFVADDSGYATLIATYKNRDGLFDPAKILIKDVSGTIEGNSKIFLLSTQPGKYEITAGALSMRIWVVSR